MDVGGALDTVYVRLIWLWLVTMAVGIGVFVAVTMRVRGSCGTVVADTGVR